MPANSTEHRDWYDTPLYYDIVFDEGTAREAAFMETAFLKHAQPAKGRRVLEPACGSGRLALEMARRGWEVSGFDGNANMINFARDRAATAGVKICLWEDLLQSFRLPGGVNAGFDLAHCLVSTFKYLLTERDAAECLHRIGGALRPGGLLYLGVHLTDYGRRTAEHERWVAERGRIRVVCNTHTWPANPKTRLEDLRTRLKITDAGRTHTQETRWQFRTYDAAQLKGLLRKVPELEYVECYDFTYDPEDPRKFDDSYADVLLVLRKRA